MLWKQRSCLPPGKSSIHTTKKQHRNPCTFNSEMYSSEELVHIFTHFDSVKALQLIKVSSWRSCNDNIFMVGFLSYTSLTCKFCRAAKYKRNPRKERVPWRPEGLLLHFASCHLGRGRHSTASCTAPCTMGVSGKFSLCKVLSLSTKKLLVLKAGCLFWESLEKIF